MTDSPVSNVSSNSSSAVFRLMQLTSPALPVGGFAYSQGLEYAIDSALLKTPEDVQAWIQGVLKQSVGRLDLPVAALAYRAYLQKDMTQFLHINAHALALRETRELYQESHQMARSLLRLLNDMGEQIPKEIDLFETDWSCAFALAAAVWDIDQISCLHGLAWTWLENQVAAAVKLLPLGQTQGQQMLFDICADLDAIIDAALLMSLDEVGASTPMLAMMSAQHETQYSRLFRS